jgi:hypothetical protein
MVYATAAAIKHGVNWISDLGWQRLEAMLEEDAAPQPQPPRRTWADFADLGN